MPLEIVPDQDWTNPEFVTGAVWAQLEELTDSQKVDVLTDILNQINERR